MENGKTEEIARNKELVNDGLQNAVV